MAGCARDAAGRARTAGPGRADCCGWDPGPAAVAPRACANTCGFAPATCAASIVAGDTDFDGGRELAADTDAETTDAADDKAPDVDTLGPDCNTRDS